MDQWPLVPYKTPSRLKCELGTPNQPQYLQGRWKTWSVSNWAVSKAVRSLVRATKWAALEKLSIKPVKTHLMGIQPLSYLPINKVFVVHPYHQCMCLPFLPDDEKLHVIISFCLKKTIREKGTWVEFNIHLPMSGLERSPEPGWVLRQSDVSACQKPDEQRCTTENYWSHW